LCRSLPGPEKPEPAIASEEAARLIVRMIDLALVDPFGRGSADLRTLRETVVEASVRLAGVA
jgi:hypothetical protein